MRLLFLRFFFVGNSDLDVPLAKGQYNGIVQFCTVLFLCLFPALFPTIFDKSVAELQEFQGKDK